MLQHKETLPRARGTVGGVVWKLSLLKLALSLELVGLVLFGDTAH